MATQRDIRNAVSAIIDAQDDAAVLNQVRWRLGRGHRANVYAVTGGDDRDKDTWIGVFFSPQLAKEAVNAHNVLLVSDPAVNITDSAGVQLGSHNTQTNTF